MNILGLSAMLGPFSHDSGAAIVKDGRLVAAAEEERFTRKKHDGSPPLNATRFCLEYAGLRLEEIDVIAIPWSPRELLISGFFELLRASSFGAQNLYLYPLMKTLFGKVGVRHLMDFVGATSTPKIMYVPHHLSHAATAYYCSGFKDSAILTVDNRGEWDATVVWKGRGESITKVYSQKYPNSLGSFYSTATINILNLGHFEDGKTMGLAGYGSANEHIRDRLTRVLDLKVGQTYKCHNNGHITEDVASIPRRSSEPPLQAPYPDFAYEVQQMLEKAMLKIARFAVEKTGSKNFGMAGGVALNCNANSAILRSGLADQIFVFPAANDGGTPVGAALQCATDLGENVSFRMEHAHLGPEWSDHEIEEVLRQLNLRFERHEDIAGVTAEILTKGKIIAWFQGRMELGPRALGNRSILADPRRTDMRDLVNQIKGREHWRPLAPSILSERMGEFLEDAVESPFMLLSFQVISDRRKDVPAIVHADGSTRPQTVRRETSERFWRLIKAFESETGIPMVLNTSFNTGGEPIVCSPTDAIRTLFGSRLDYLAIGNCLVSK